jgi:hypothetical protein
MPNTTDSLDRLRDHDPARTMSALSTNEREAIRDRIVTSPTTAPRARRAARPLRTTLRRGRVLIAVGVVLVGGGVATAAILDQGTTTLVAHGLSCMSGTNNDASSGAYNVEQNGDSPTAACAPVIGVAASTLVACAKPQTGVVVYEADSDPAGQCQSLGLTPLPTDYSAAITQIHALQQALTADYDQSDCISPSQLAQDANADLQRLGFTGWHAVIDTTSAAGAEFAGPCGQFPASGSAISTANAALEADNHTVMIEIGAPRSVLQLAESVTMPTIDASGQQCYTLAGAQQLVHDMLDKAAGRTVPVEFAVTKEQTGTTAMDGSGSAATDGRQQQYDQGCTIVSGFGAASDGQTFQVMLQNNAGAPFTDGTPSNPSPQGATTSAFQSDLTNG